MEAYHDFLLRGLCRTILHQFYPWAPSLLILPAVFTTLLIYLCMTISTKSAVAQILPEQFPDGFKVTKPVEYYDPGNLYELINGQAVFYLSYGFVKLDHAYYEKDGDSYKVDVYELADRLSALGSYRQQKDEDTTEMNVGTEGYVIDYLSAFYKEKYYVEIVPMDEGDITEMKHLAGYVEKSIPGTTEPPQELKLFPQDGLIPNSEMYFGESLLSYSFMGKGLSAMYKQEQDNKEIRIFISLKESEKQAKITVEEFRERLEKNISWIENNFGDITVSGVSGTLAYRGNSVIFSYDKYVFGCISYTNFEETNLLLVKLFQNLKTFTNISE